MENVLENIAFLSPYVNPKAAAAIYKDLNMRSVEQLILALLNPDFREAALLELATYKKNRFPNLAVLLWNTPGTIAILLQEVVSIYSVLSPPKLSREQSNRVCNALALLQCVAAHPETKMPFLNAYIPLYLYPFLNTDHDSTAFEHLRLTALGVLGFLVLVIDIDVVTYFLSGEVVPLCMRNMEIGSGLSKTVATYIIRQILFTDVGLDYICDPKERFFALCRVLGNLISVLSERSVLPKLLRLIVECYLRLCDNARACDALRRILPRPLRDGTFNRCLQDDLITAESLQRLLYILYGPR